MFYQNFAKNYSLKIHIKIRKAFAFFKKALFFNIIGTFAGL